MTETEFKNIIKHRGYDVYTLSKKLNYSRNTVYQWLKREREPCSFDILRLSNILNISIETIVRYFGE